MILSIKIAKLNMEKKFKIKQKRIENTTPVTKNTVLSITDERLICTVEFSLKPDMVVPDMYARNAGITGRMHGATNDARPATTATRMPTSAMMYKF